MKFKALRNFFVTVGLSAIAFLMPGCTTYIQSPAPPVVETAPAPPPVQYAPPPPVQYEETAPEAPLPVEYVPAPAPPPPSETVVVVQTESDFEEPLSPYGRWVDVPDYGHCWVPTRVDHDWRPYTNGHWQRTDAGWYWVSDEPWGWATCHYGRWYLDSNYGWVWVPQTQWAPAWVCWREGGGYTGWAPLPPEARVGPDGHLEHPEEHIDPHNYVFVEQRKMLEPQRPQTVIVNNITIVQKTVNITKIVVVNKIVVNEGPSPQVVARVTGHRVDVVAAHSVRARQEAPAIQAHHLRTNQAGGNPPSAALHPGDEQRPAAAPFHNPPPSVVPGTAVRGNEPVGNPAYRPPANGLESKPGPNGEAITPANRPYPDVTAPPRHAPSEADNPLRLANTNRLVEYPHTPGSVVGARPEDRVRNENMPLENRPAHEAVNPGPPGYTSPRLVTPGAVAPPANEHNNAATHHEPDLNRPGGAADQVRPTPNQPGGHNIPPGQARPELSPEHNAPSENHPVGQHEVAPQKNGQPGLTPQQQLDLEKKKALEKRRQEEEKAHTGLNTNLPPKP